MRLSRTPVFLQVGSIGLIALFLTAMPASAQYPLRIPPDAKGNQIRQILQANMRIRQAYQEAHASVPTPPPPPPRYPGYSFNSGVHVHIEGPAQATTKAPLVSIQGPNGETRQFPLVGGQSAIVVRDVVVHPGEKVTIRINPR